VTSQGDAVTRVVQAFEESDWSEIDVRFGTLRVHLSAKSDEAISVPTANSQSDTVPVPAPVRVPPTIVGRTATAPPAQVDVPSGARAVVSPSPGIFWSAPEPGAPPFTAVGQQVNESTTVGIVEVMKLMNHVKAGVGGEVVAVFVDNGGAVDKDQTLVAVIPHTSRAET
jgi:acetyl-CoA carboxylase biotin carboxyl carrier protein